MEIVCIVYRIVSLLRDIRRSRSTDSILVSSYLHTLIPINHPIYRVYSVVLSDRTCYGTRPLTIDRIIIWSAKTRPIHYYGPVVFEIIVYRGLCRLFITLVRVHCALCDNTARLKYGLDPEKRKRGAHAYRSLFRYLTADSAFAASDTNAVFVNSRNNMHATGNFVGRDFFTGRGSVHYFFSNFLCFFLLQITIQTVLYANDSCPNSTHRSRLQSMLNPVLKEFTPFTHIHTSSYVVLLFRDS